MKIHLTHGEILQDHTLKAFISALESAHGHDRTVLVDCPRDGNGETVFEILTIEREAELEAQP